MPNQCKASICVLFHYVLRQRSLKVVNLTIGRRPGMTVDQRNIAIGVLTADLRAREVTRHFNFSTPPFVD